MININPSKIHSSHCSKYEGIFLKPLLSLETTCLLLSLPTRISNYALSNTQQVDDTHKNEKNKHSPKK